MRLPGLSGVFTGLFASCVPQPGDYLVQSLARRLALETAPIARGDLNNFWYLRKKTFTEGELSDPSTVPYDLRWVEGHNISNLLTYAFDCIVPGASLRTAQEWRRERREDTYKGRPLHTLSLLEPLKDVLSKEALDFLWDSENDETIFNQWNAAVKKP